MARLPNNLPLRPRGLIRTPRPSPRHFFHTTPPSRSMLFNLGGLAGSRESQYLSRERGLPRTEYSSRIHLIRSGEVDPFAPAPGASSSGAAREAPQEAEREAASGLQEPSARADPHRQARMIQAMAAELKAAGQEIALLRRALRDAEESYESIRNSAMIWPGALVAALALAYAFGDVWRGSRPSRGEEDAVAQHVQHAARIGEDAQGQQAAVAGEKDMQCASHGTPPHGEAHERGRGSFWGWLMWAPGSVAK